MLLLLLVFCTCFFLKKKTFLLLLHVCELYSNINLSLAKSENKIRNWKHDLESQILEIELTRNCTVSSHYGLELKISYKDYGKVQRYENSGQVPRMYESLKIRLT